MSARRWQEGGVSEGHEETLEVMSMIVSMTVMLVSQAQTHVKTHQTVFSKYILYPNKAVEKGEVGVSIPKVFTVKPRCLHPLWGCSFIHMN